MKARQFLIPVLGLWLFSTAGCVSAQRSGDQSAPNPEADWIIDGRPAEFSGEFWRPQDDIENLLDSGFVVPGIGTIHGFWASSQASAIWAGVAFLLSAILPSRSTRDLFACRASGVKRGSLLRKSELSNVVFSFILPVRNPLPSGL